MAHQPRPEESARRAEANSGSAATRAMRRSEIGSAVRRRCIISADAIERDLSAGRLRARRAPPRSVVTAVNADGGVWRSIGTSQAVRKVYAPTGDLTLCD